MPDLRVVDVSTRPTQPAGQPVPVTVLLDNKETVAFAWENSTCEQNGEMGHKATVTLTARDGSGETVASPSRQVCIPRNRLGQLGGANLREEFSITLPEPGDYTIRAEVDAINAVGGDQSSPVGITATDPSNTEDATDDGSGAVGGGSTINLGGGSDGVDGGVNLPDPTGGAGDKVLLAVVLLALAWIASSGSDIAEVFD